MKRPWQVWLFYCLAVAIVVPAMGWLTHRTLMLERAEIEARRQEALARQEALQARKEAEREELISEALWRMDTKLAAIVGAEAARPYFLYGSFYPSPLNPPGYNTTKPISVKGGVSQVASPLLTNPPDYVVVHFQIYPEAKSEPRSPQAPRGSWKERAIQAGAQPKQIERATERVEELARVVDYDRLLPRLPERTLPVLSQSEWALNVSNSLPLHCDPVVNGFAMRQMANLDQQAPNEQSPATGNGQTAAQPRGAQPQAGQRNDPEPQARGPQPSANAPPQNEQQQAAISHDVQVKESQYYLGRVQQSRGSYGWHKRNRGIQTYAQNMVAQQRANYNYEPVREAVTREGLSKTLWVGDRLIVARRVIVGGRAVIQGAWLDWPKIKELLLAEAAELRDEVDLLPVSDDEPPVKWNRLLASLPVKLETPSLGAIGLTATPSKSHIRSTLTVAWVCLGLALAAVALLLLGVVSLSERRGAFVSAVTHELRTPLTTFRMYAEMLSEGMVADEKQKKGYLDTLRVESDRLSHLVENVLSYARLERGKRGGRRQPVSLGGLVDRIESRLRDRAAQAEMELVVEAQDADRQFAVLTDPQAAEQIVFNLVDNACKYAAAADDRRIHLRLETVRAHGRIVVVDHGPGLSEQAARSLFTPFSKSAEDAAVTAPGVGLGLALCRRLARQVGGQLRLASGGGGATFVLEMPSA